MKKELDLPLSPDQRDAGKEQNDDGNEEGSHCHEGVRPPRGIDQEGENLEGGVFIHPGAAVYGAGKDIRREKATRADHLPPGGKDPPDVIILNGEKRQEKHRQKRDGDASRPEEPYGSRMNVFGQEYALSGSGFRFNASTYSFVNQSMFSCKGQKKLGSMGQWGQSLPRQLTQEFPHSPHFATPSVSYPLIPLLTPWTWDGICMYRVIINDDQHLGNLPVNNASIVPFPAVWNSSKNSCVA